MSLIAFFDIETDQQGKHILDIGCILPNGSTFHKNHAGELAKFVEKADFIGGHNILQHDLPCLQKYFGIADWGLDKAIDTLLLSPLLFPKNPYHHLLKDDKLQNEERNNPVNDSLKASRLFDDEVM